MVCAEGAKCCSGAGIGGSGAVPDKRCVSDGRGSDMLSECGGQATTDDSERGTIDSERVSLLRSGE
jgi:hypothetical protein